MLWHRILWSWLAKMMFFSPSFCSASTSLIKMKVMGGLKIYFKNFPLTIDLKVKGSFLFYCLYIESSTMAATQITSIVCTYFGKHWNESSRQSSVNNIFSIIWGNQIAEYITWRGYDGRGAMYVIKNHPFLLNPELYQTNNRV